MVSAVSEDERSACRRARTLDSVLSGALGKSLRAMAGEHSGLVHQPAGVVGAPHTGMVCEREVRGRRSEVRNYVGIEPPADAENWQQDEDTLDTWFSSWLWAYETMDPETRAKFYPTSVLVTGPDIIFFWVARIIIAGLEFKPGKSERDQDNIPF